MPSKLRTGRRGVEKLQDSPNLVPDATFIKTVRIARTRPIPVQGTGAATVDRERSTSPLNAAECRVPRARPLLAETTGEVNRMRSRITNPPGNHLRDPEPHSLAGRASVSLTDDLDWFVCP